MTLNPIFALELRARWRMNRSFLLILGLALALGGVALFIYQRAALDAGVTVDIGAAANTPARSFNARASFVGRELFVSLAHANILIWLLLSGASAATGIARERERGLLESLQLSQMKAPEQIAARLGSNLMLLGALQLILLPIYSIAFTIGGVSPADIARAFTLVGWSSLLGTALGLWFSARSHRPTGALFGALGTLILFSLGLLMLSANASGPPGAQEILWYFHPTALFWALTEPNAHPFLAPRFLVPLESALWLALCAALLWNATRQVARTLPPPAWQTRSRWVEKLKAKHAAKPPQPSRRQKASGALLADIPLDRFVRFSDPLLAREVKGRFRLRAAGFWVGLVRIALFGVAVGLWLWEISWLLDAPSRAEMVPSGLRIFLFGGTLVLAALAATSWTHERESGTWEGLKLSLLSPRQILRAKWLSPLVSFAYYSAPLWILLPFGVPFVGASAALMGGVVALAWLGLATALGLWVSWRVQNGAAAIAWTVGLLALVLVGLPGLNSLAGVDDALARWRFGVNGYRDMELAYSYSGGYRADVVERYQAATGNQVAKPVKRTYPTPSGMTATYVDYHDEALGNWLQNQFERARAFEMNLWAWHPNVALQRIFGEGERPIGNYYGTPPKPTRADQTSFAFALSTLIPLALTLVFLGLLRRDVRREQLNA